MLSHKLPTDGFGEGSVILRPCFLDEEDDSVKGPCGQKTRRFKPLIKAKLARLYFIPKQVTEERTQSGKRMRKTGTMILSQLTCKSCQRVFHKRTGLSLHSCKRPSTKQHKPIETKTGKNPSVTAGKNLRNMQALSISTTCPRRSTQMPFGCNFPPKRVEVKLRRLRSRHPGRPSSSLPNDSHSVSGEQVCLKRMTVKLHRCELPTGFNSPRCFPSFHHSSHSLITNHQFSSTSTQSWQSKKPMKRKHQMTMVSYPAKTPCIEDMKKTKTGDDEDEEVVILWQG